MELHEAVCHLLYDVIVLIQILQNALQTQHTIPCENMHQRNCSTAISQCKSILSNDKILHKITH